MRNWNYSEINITNFKIDNVTNMRYMFSRCSLLQELYISNFIFNDANDIDSMFSRCSDELKNIIKEQNIKLIIIYKEFKRKLN